jgi:flavodoxin
VKDRKIIIYESWTGNTEKIAKEIANVLQCRTVKVNEVLPEQVKDCQLLVLGTPVHNGCPLSGIERLLEELQAKGFPGFYALFCTYGASWREFSARDCLARMEKFGKQKCLGEFYCPGFHEIFGTFQGRPNHKDFDNARIFAENILEALKEASGG